MQAVQWTVEGTAKSIRQIFKDAGKDCNRLPGFVRLQSDDASAGKTYYGGSDVTAGPANAGGYVAPGGVETLVAVNPNTVPTEETFLVGTAADVLFITVG